MKELLNNLEINVSKDSTDQSIFEGLTDKLIYKSVQNDECGLLCGKSLGVKDKNGKEILIDNLLGESSLNLCMESLLCIYIPDKDILKRTKYQWFSRLNHVQILEGNTQLSKFFLLSHGK